MNKYELNEEQLKIFEENYPLALNTANKWNKYIDGVEFDDILQECLIGLILSIKRYNSKKAKLSTYAVSYMNGKVKNYLKRSVFKFKNEFSHGLELRLDYFNHTNEKEHSLFISELVGTAESCFKGKKLEAVKMYVYDDMSIVDIGKNLGVSQQRAQQYINDFRRLCKSHYKNYKEVI